MLHLAVTLQGGFSAWRSATLRSVMCLSVFSFPFILILQCSGVLVVLLLPIPFLFRMWLSPRRRWGWAGLGWTLSALFPVGASSPRFRSEPVWWWWRRHVCRVVRVIRVCSWWLRSCRVWRADWNVHQRSCLFSGSIGLVDIEGHGS